MEQPRPDQVTWKQNVERDAALVRAALNGTFELEGIHQELTPNELFAYHPRWLKRQPQAYRDAVVEAAGYPGLDLRGSPPVHP